MTRRNIKRRIERQQRLSYINLFLSLTPRDQHTINEKVIWAVIDLTDPDGVAPIGTKAFLENRAKQLILDMLKTGFRTASQRYRKAVNRQQKANKDRAEMCMMVPGGTNAIPAVPEVANNPLKSMPQNGVLAGLRSANSPIPMA